MVHDAQRILDNIQEDELAEFLREMDHRGMRLRLNLIEERAQNIIATIGSTHILGVH